MGDEMPITLHIVFLRRRLVDTEKAPRVRRPEMRFTPE